MKNGVIDYAVYERGKDYLGTANIQLPEIVQKVLSYYAAGLGGDMEFPTGKVDAMEVTINWVTVTDSAYNLSTMREHQIEVRVAHGAYDQKKIAFLPEGVKYVMTIMPKSESMGQVQPSSPQAISGVYACHSFKMFIGNKLVRHVDPGNNINWDKDNGNILSGVNKILGK